MDAHERSNETFLKLAERGIITVYDTIDEEMVAHVRDRLAVARAYRVNEIEINIQTIGGNIVAGLDIHDMIRVASVERRRGLVLGFAHSMGIVILQACEIREATRNARFLLHHVTVDEKIPLPILRNPKRLKKLIAGGELCQRDLEIILAKRTGRRLSDIRKACAESIEMTSEEALAFGLIDAIRD